MPRLTDVDALINDVVERYCKDCERRKGVKNGKKKVIYDIGDAPCRACEVDDMKYKLENAPTVDAVEVVRCKDCIYQTECTFTTSGNGFCAWGERREDAEPIRHGHWMTDLTGAEYCSECNQYPYDDGEYRIANWNSNYCPNCGAKMDEVEDV